MAINKAQEFVKEEGDLNIPLHLRNAPTKLMKELDYGKNYNYSHDHLDKLHLQEFLPEEIKGESFYVPKTNKEKKNIASLLIKYGKGNTTINKNGF